MTWDDSKPDGSTLNVDELDDATREQLNQIVKNYLRSLMPGVTDETLQDTTTTLPTSDKMLGERLTPTYGTWDNRPGASGGSRSNWDPTAPETGELYYATDLQALLRHDGSNWIIVNSYPVFDKLDSDVGIGSFDKVGEVTLPSVNGCLTRAEMVLPVELNSAGEEELRIRLVDDPAGSNTELKTYHYHIETSTKKRHDLPFNIFHEWSGISGVETKTIGLRLDGVSGTELKGSSNEAGYFSVQHIEGDL